MARALTTKSVVDVCSRVMAGPFVWGACDCCSAPLVAFRELTGYDVMAETGVSWKTARDAIRLIEKHGSLVHAMVHVLGQTRLVYGPARPGALGIYKNDSVPALMHGVGAIYLGPQAWIVKFEGPGYIVCKSQNSAGGWSCPL